MNQNEPPNTEQQHWAEKSPWLPTLQEKSPILSLVNSYKILYEKYQNPFFIWLARFFAKEIPRNHSAIDTKWIDDELDALEARILGLLFNPPEGDFAKAAAKTLGFVPARGRGTPASMAQTTLQDELIYIKINGKQRSSLSKKNKRRF
jgi:hypothetical protein